MPQRSTTSLALPLNPPKAPKVIKTSAPTMSSKESPPPTPTTEEWKIKTQTPPSSYQRTWNQRTAGDENRSPFSIVPHSAFRCANSEQGGNRGSIRSNKLMPTISTCGLQVFKDPEEPVIVQDMQIGTFMQVIDSVDCQTGASFTADPSYDSCNAAVSPRTYPEPPFHPNCSTACTFSLACDAHTLKLKQMRANYIPTAACDLPLQRQRRKQKQPARLQDFVTANSPRKERLKYGALFDDKTSKQSCFDRSRKYYRATSPATPSQLQRTQSNPHPLRPPKSNEPVQSTDNVLIQSALAAAAAAQAAATAAGRPPATTTQLPDVGLKDSCIGGFNGSRVRRRADGQKKGTAKRLKAQEDGSFVQGAVQSGPSLAEELLGLPTCPVKHTHVQPNATVSLQRQTSVPVVPKAKRGRGRPPKRQSAGVNVPPKTQKGNGEADTGQNIGAAIQELLQQQGNELPSLPMSTNADLGNMLKQLSFGNASDIDNTSNAMILALAQQLNVNLPVDGDKNGEGSTVDPNNALLDLLAQQLGFGSINGRVGAAAASVPSTPDNNQLFNQIVNLVRLSASPGPAVSQPAMVNPSILPPLPNLALPTDLSLVTSLLQNQPNPAIPLLPPAILNALPASQLLNSPIGPLATPAPIPDIASVLATVLNNNTNTPSTTPSMPIVASLNQMLSGAYNELVALASSNCAAGLQTLMNSNSGANFK